MEIKILNKVLTLILIPSFTLPSSLFANSTQGAADTKIVGKWNRMRSNWLTLKTPTQVEKELARMNFSYNPRFEKQDKKFMESLALQTTELPEITMKENGYVVSEKKDSSSKLTIQALGQNRYILNGKKFEYDLNTSLEKNFEKMNSLFESEQVSSSILNNLFLPYSYASMKKTFTFVVIGAVALFLGGMIYEYNNHKSEKGTAPSNGKSNSHSSGRSGLSTYQIGAWQGEE